MYGAFCLTAEGVYQVGVLVVICVVIWILAFLIRLGSGDNANTPPKPVAPKINTRVMKNAVDLHINELPQIQTERPSVPAELEQALENAQRVYSLLRLQYAVSSRKTPFLKRMGQETRKRLNLIKSTIRRIKDEKELAYI